MKEENIQIEQIDEQTMAINNIGVFVLFLYLYLYCCRSISLENLVLLPFCFLCLSLSISCVLLLIASSYLQYSFFRLIRFKPLNFTITNDHFICSLRQKKTHICYTDDFVSYYFFDFEFHPTSRLFFFIHLAPCW